MGPSRGTSRGIFLYYSAHARHVENAADAREPRRDEFRLCALTHFPKNHFAKKIKDENHAPRCTLSTLLHLSTSQAACDQPARLLVLEIVQTLCR